LDTRACCQLLKIVDAIENNINIFNSKENAPYNLKLTAGYNIFECGAGLTKTDILNEIDRQMYSKKRK
jgi:hypothetical protein